ncbi:uncharacterized protein LOC127856183 [Dreissena polymorpha]|uniref:Uncharacterized protein n=1 Tax=Dreissena polymorpha TaxID=45954 RepID=A0A9D4NAB8_DREPO|nr:uncharacterized protein LOC127856183 [Dreissena polymorpha]XP_052248225.1 uncharacterized protein LOC127856183 [Dreissena polymorpha]KAH3891920.1 hypothetical protein DPMN_016030 [Dreissena polymorpha]
MCNMDENKAVGESSDILRDEVECDDEAVQGVISAQREKIMTMRRLKRGMSTEIKGLNKVTITMKRQASFAEELQYLDGRQNENKLPKQTITKPPNSSSEIRSTLLIKNVSLKQKPLKETKQFRCEDEQKSLMGVATPDIHHIVGKYKPGPKSKRKLLNGCDNGPKIKSCRKSYDKSSEYITLQQLMDHCLHRYYRLKGANWECSSDAALKLLTKKYNSLKLLFSRTLVLQLKRVKLKIHPAMPPVKLQNESKGLTHCSSYESDDNKICHSRTQIKSVNPLVDPRVMSMSKALQSSNSGKVGIEKTFKSAPTLKKVKKDIKTKETGRKSLMSRPDWSKFKEKLKEANSRLISKKKDGLIIGKTLGNASLYANNTCSGLTSAPFVQAKLPHFRIPRKVLETDPSDSKLTIDSTTDKQKEQDTSKHDNIFDRFKCDNLAESKSNGGKKTIENFVLDGYTIEITRDSPVDVTMQEVSDDDDVAPETDIEHNASLLSEEIHKNIKHETLTVEESDENGIVDIENVSDEAHSTESVEQTCVETSKSNSGNCMSVSSLNIEGRNVVEIEDEQSSYEISETDKDKRNPTKDDINTTLQKMLHHIEHFGTDVNAVDDIVSSVLDGALQHVEDYSQFQIVENPDLQSKVSLQHPSKLGKVTNHSENRSQRCKCSYLHFDNLEQQGNDNKVVKCLCEVSTRENKQKEFTRCNDNTDFVINNKNDLHLKCQQCVEDDIILVEEVFTKKDCTCRNISAFKSANSNTLTPNLSSLSGHMNKKQQHCFLCKDAAYKISEYTNSPRDISREKSNKCTCEKHIPSLKGIKPKFVNTFVEMTETDSSAAKLEMDAKQVIVEDSETDDEIESDCNSANEVSTKLINLNEKTTAKTKTFSMPTKEVNKSAKTLEPTSAPTCTQCKDKDGKGQPYSDVYVMRKGVSREPLTSRHRCICRRVSQEPWMPTFRG